MTWLPEVIVLCVLTSCVCSIQCCHFRTHGTCKYDATFPISFVRFCEQPGRQLRHSHLWQKKLIWLNVTRFRATSELPNSPFLTGRGTNFVSSYSCFSPIKTQVWAEVSSSFLTIRYWPSKPSENGVCDGMFVTSCAWSLPLCEPGMNQRQPFSSVASSRAIHTPNNFSSGSVNRNVPSWWQMTKCKQTRKS